MMKYDENDDFHDISSYFIIFDHISFFIFSIF